MFDHDDTNLTSRYSPQGPPVYGQNIRVWQNQKVTIVTFVPFIGFQQILVLFAPISFLFWSPRDMYFLCLPSCWNSWDFNTRNMWVSLNRSKQSSIISI
ncbi:hypothetical protein HanIR_Chr04g0155011 [Helianthus annuus]|nr:hypothetical protein HanIR_Chr04g0155011 [Helianthus annuus]